MNLPIITDSCKTEHAVLKKKLQDYSILPRGRQIDYRGV